MTIADKVRRGKDDLDRAHAAGIEEGKALGGYTKGYTDGKQDERNAFWDAFQTPTRKDWIRAFQDASWNDNTFYPKHDIAPKGDASSLFRYCGITDLEGRLDECGVVLDTSRATNLNNAFAQSTLTVIPPLDMSSCTAAGALNGTFSGCTSLKTIRKIIISINSNAETADAFTYCLELENVTFEGEIGLSFNFRLSSKLSYNSIRSIVNALTEDPTKAPGKTLTLSRAAVNNGFTYYIGEGYDPVLPEDPSNPIWQPLIAPKVAAGWTITLA